VVTGTPLLRLVEGCDAHAFGDRLGGEDEVQLPRRGLWSLPIVVERRDVLTVGRQFVGPRLDLSAVRRLRADEAQPESGRPFEHGPIAVRVVGVSVLAVAVQDVPVAGDYQAVLAVNMSAEKSDRIR